jgi:hypothetical protein
VRDLLHDLDAGEVGCEDPEGVDRRIGYHLGHRAKHLGVAHVDLRGERRRRLGRLSSATHDAHDIRVTHAEP